MKQNNVRIKGIRTASGNQIFIDGKPLHPGHSQTFRNHSPDGFNWGYGGSGPAQTALAICLDVLANKWLALELYQEFKWAHVARWPANSEFEVTVDLLLFLTDYPEEIERAKDNEEFENSLQIH